MDKEMLAYFRNLLELRYREAQAEMNGQRALIGRQGENLGPMDEADLATYRHSQDFAIRIQNRHHQLLTEIRTALVRIGSGDFGMCEECSGEIGMERLKLQPTTTVCIDCKRSREVLGRFRSHPDPHPDSLSPRAADFRQELAADRMPASCF